MGVASILDVKSALHPGRNIEEQRCDQITLAAEAKRLRTARLTLQSRAPASPLRVLP